MPDDVYPYDQELHDRSFLNCYQRQAMVMLAERVPDLPLLYGAGLVSSDSILEQVIRSGEPKYDFQSSLFSGLGLLGITRTYEPADTFAEAKPLLLEALSTVGYAIPFIDVYYLPHTPEYRDDHIVHTVCLTGYDPATGVWSLLDDNRASVLCRYSYPESVLDAAYSKGKLRHVSWFPTSAYSQAEAVSGSAAAFASSVAAYSDSYTLLDRAGDMLASPFFSPRRAATLLYDAFSVYQGSRRCLREFLGRQPELAGLAPVVGSVEQHCQDLRNQFMIGKAVGRVDAARVVASCAELRSADEDLVTLLRETAAVGAL